MPYNDTRAYLIIDEPELFVVLLLLLALHIHIFAVTRAQRISSPSPLSLDAFRVLLLCPMRTAALPQSIAEKDIAGSFMIIVLHVTGRSGHQ
jgi:hypothetical protein